MGSVLKSVLLDTHVLYWAAASPDALTPRARKAIDEADELAVAAITWYEFAWLAERDRIRLSIPVRSWMDEYGRLAQTVNVTRPLAMTAAWLPDEIGGDPVDRIIYATALETGMQLVTKDERLRRFNGPRDLCVW